MKQALWIINSSVVGLLLLSLTTLQLLRKNPPKISRIVPPTLEEKTQAKQPFPDTHWETIFKFDLFDTYIQNIPQPIQKDLVTPIPEIKEPEAPVIPEPKAPEFLPELALSIKGIIIAADETQNVIMIEDETKKESTYHIGDMYKDGQIIKISRNSVVFLRTNGQQEAFYLRKEDADLAMNGPTKWEYVVKKLDNNSWQIDPESFKSSVDSLGDFIDRLNLIGTAYQQGTALGIRLDKQDQNGLGELLGLQAGDIVTSINGISVAQAPNRVQIFDTVSLSKPGDTVVATINRRGRDVTNIYKIDYISKAKQVTISDNKDKPAEPDKTTNQPQPDLKMSKNQEREKQVREFSDRHENAQQKEAIAQVRKRLLENLRARLKAARTR